MEQFKTKRNNHPGQTIVELLVVIAVSAVLLPAILTIFILGRQSRPQTLQRAQATALVTEANEAVRAIRNGGWENVNIDGVYHPEIAANNWVLVAGSENINGFVRSVEITPVFRDASGNVVQSGGTNDPSSKYVTVSVSWDSPRTSLEESTFVITRYRDNLAYIQTTEEDFETGEFTGTTTLNQAGGEISLGSGGGGDWCGPNLSINPVDLPKSGVANGLTAIEGKAFAGTGDNASGVSFAKVDITNTNPPVGAINGEFNGYKTNDIFGETDYAYLATDTNSKEIVIVSLTGTPTETGYFDGSGPTDANAVYVSGNVGYMVQGNNFRTFDLSSKSGARIQFGSVTLAGTGTEVMVVGNYAYVSVSGSSTKLQIIDVSNPSSLSVIGSATITGSNAQDVFVNDTGTRTYLATVNNSSGAEMYIIDTTTKSGSRPTVGSYEANGMSPKALTVVPGNILILVGTGGEEYQAITIANESNPTRCGGMQSDAGINGVASVLESDGDAYSYIITGDSSSELKIIEGGPGGQYASSGTYESLELDMGVSTAVNRITFNMTLPNQTTGMVQIAVADQVNSNCQDANYQFVGPDGTSATFYTTGGGVPFNDDSIGYENPGRCLKYKVYLSTSDSTQTPVFSDITINYSP